LVAEVVVTERKSDFTRHDRWLFACGALASAAWMLHLTISYALVPESCGDGTKWMLHLATIICAPLTLVAAAIAWRVRSTLHEGRRRWMAGMTAGLCVSMTILVLAQEIPNLILRSCD
jgi:O-antigen ligase